MSGPPDTGVVGQLRLAVALVGQVVELVESTCSSLVEAGDLLTSVLVGSVQADAEQAAWTYAAEAGAELADECRVLHEAVVSILERVVASSRWRPYSRAQR